MSESITLNQSLYGYDSGHKLISSSINIDVPYNSQQLLLRLSDATVTNISVREPVCITGYPLTEIKKYALIMTWSAPENTRSGCVWSHAIFIDFSDMGKMDDLSFLLDLFKYPDFGDYRYYKDRIKVECVDNLSNNKKHSGFGHSESIVNQLYATPKSQVQINVDDTILYTLINVWSQQWPSLRRNFSFRTQYSILKERFDVVGSQRILDSYDLGDVKPPGWVDVIAKDLYSDTTSEFRRFLWRLGATCINDRSSFMNLTKLYIAKNESILSIFNVLDEWGNCPNIVAETVILDALNVDDQVITFNVLDSLMAKYSYVVLPIINSNVSKFISGFSVGDILEAIDRWPSFTSDILPKILPSLNDNTIFSLLDNNSSFLIYAVRYKKSIVRNRFFWEYINNLSDLEDLILESSRPFIDDIVKSAILYARDGIAKELVRVESKYIPETILEYCDELFNDVDVTPWLVAVSGYQDLFENLIKTMKVSSLDKLEVFSMYMLFDKPCVDNGEDIWLRHLEKGVSREYEGLIIFLFKRSLFFKDIRLAKATFDSIFYFLKNDELSYGGWQSLKTVLPEKNIPTIFSIWNVFVVHSSETRLDRLVRCVIKRFDFTESDISEISDDSLVSLHLQMEVKGVNS